MASRIDAATEYYTRDLSGDDPAFGTAGFTFAGWFQINTDRNTYSSWLCFYGAGSIYWNIATESDGLVVWGFWDHGPGSAGVSIFTATANTWYFLAGTHPIGTSGYALTYYHAPALTGALTTVTSGATAANFTPTTLEIGRDGDATEFLNGTAGPVKMWNRVLTVNEINAERWQVAPVSRTSLWAFHPLFHGGTNASALADWSGNGRTLGGGTANTPIAGPPVPWRRGRARPAPYAGAAAPAYAPVGSQFQPQVQPYLRRTRVAAY